MSVVSAREKLEEVQYFYRQFQRPDVDGELNHVKHTLSALIGAARATRWHISHEAETNPTLKSWWDEQEIHLCPCVRYFDARRTIEIHEETGAVTRRTQVNLTASAALSGELMLLVTRADGTTESFAAPPSPPPESPRNVPPSTQHTYVLADYPGGDRNMLDACGELIGHLEAFVKGAEENAQ